LTPVTTRHSEARDATRIAELLCVLGYPSSADEVVQRLAAVREHRDFTSWIADADGIVVGFIGACVTPSFEKNGVFGRILALVVDPAAQGSGIGRLLVETAERWMSERGATDVFVNSGNHRPAAHEFYRRMGYDATGLRFRKVL
jgi:GNAT superfamily N-acetyltransferase